ncbi:MAG TPA: DUF1365 domain-containing protein [Rhizomicrobium sp.]|nr:DUF1365 domain-containing protein [Rhizomicrobium sp.]
MAGTSSIYEGWVMHRRLTPRHHRFKYSVFALLLDLDELPALDRDLHLFTCNRRGLFSFRDSDHGPANGEEPRDLRRWLDGLLADAGIAARGARRVLCYPRILGFVFNPLSVWFCHDEDGALKAIVYEVHNTYEERHAYVLAVGENTRLIRHGCAKSFYVSPFLSRDCRYLFRVRPPGDDIAVAIHEEEAGRPILNASFAGERRPLTDAMLLKMLFAYPLMTLKVIAAIHYEAVRLMLKGVRRHPHRAQAVYTADVPAE